MQLFILFLVAVLPALALSQSTIDERALFENTVKRWNVQIRNRRDLSERWKRLVQAKRNVDATTSGVMLESLNRFAINNEEEHAALTARAKRSANLTITMMNAMSEEAEEKRLVKRVADDPAVVLEMPPSFDYWEKEVGLTEPKNQKSCGSCWSFPTTGALEALYKKLTGERVSFAEQYFVDCTFPYSGCAGGVVNDGFKLVKRTQFLPLDDNYAYTANYNKDVGCPESVKEDMKAERNNGMRKMLLQEWYPLSHDEAGFLSGLKYSPVAFGAYVGDNILDYSGGVYEDKHCVTDPSPHAQLLVGYTEIYIRVRGSYGPTWGEGGYANYKRSGYLQSCNYFKNAFFILATQKKEIEYGFCKDGKLATRDECKDSCQSMNTETENGWDLAVIPSQMHNQQVFEMANAAFPGFKADEKFKLLWLGLNDPEKHDHYHWSDHCTPVNYVNFARPMVTPAKFGLFDKNTGKWHMKNSQTFRARGLCSRATTCWDITSAVQNGKVTFDTAGSLVEGTSATVACPGCTLEGADTLRCAGGLWNNNEPLPTCVSCEDHDHDENGEQDHSAEDHEDHDHDENGEQDHAAEDHEDHDHDEDGEQDHAAEDHEDKKGKSKGKKSKGKKSKGKKSKGKKGKGKI